MTENRTLPPAPPACRLLRQLLHPPVRGLVLGLVLVAGSACAPSSSAEEVPVDSAAVRSDILDLVAAVTPVSPSAPVEERNSWFGRRRETLERLRVAGEAVGLAALEEYHARADSLATIRSGLLDVAAHNAPVATRPVLVDLVAEYGDDLAVRTRAAELLGDTSPEQAIELLEPILLHELSGRTYPREEHLLAAWYQAVQAVGADPIPVLCTVATDLPRPLDVRHAAIKLLGETPSTQGRQALEQLIVESTGNHMLRRFAAQSLRSTIEQSELCALLDRIIENESDTGFAVFLDNMRVADCP